MQQIRQKQTQNDYLLYFMTTLILLGSVVFITIKIKITIKKRQVQNADKQKKEEELPLQPTTTVVEKPVEEDTNPQVYTIGSISIIVTRHNVNTPTSKDLEIAAAEGVWAYHTVQENHSFRSNDLSISTDASNHGSQKVFPILVRYFLPYEGVQVKLLEFKELFGENSDIIVFYVADVLREHNILSKIVAFCGDNTNCNFGGSEKKGKNNVFAKLNQITGRSLIGIGCVAHVIHNSIKCATDCLPFDIECIIVKIYSFFYIYTVREEALKQFCEAAGTEYQKLLGYSKTRWLALMPAIERVLQLYVPLKKYFLSIKKCPTVLKNFFECPTSELWLFFVHSQSVTFHTAVLRIEGQNISAIEAAKVINELRANLEEKLSSIFLPYSVRRLLSDLQKKGEVQEDYVKSIAWDFYKTTTEYLQQWTSYNQSELQIFKWVDLRKILTWVEVQKSMDVLIEKGLIGSEQDTEVFDEFTLISSYVSDKVEEWNSDSSNKYAEHRWIEVFQYFRDNNLNHTIFQKIVEYVLCMPATNAPVERIFSLMNNLWTAEKTQLQVSSLKAMLLTKVNFKMSCTEFYSFLKSSPDLLQQICSNEKYTSI
ncbi:hypothetical protein QTP88_000177 [Uroleucon formosanum]